MAARILPSAGRVAAGSHHLLQCGGEALAATYGAKVGMHLADFCEPADPDLGQQLDHLQPALLDVFAQAAKARVPSWCIDPGAPETADKCHQHIAIQPGTDGALALGLMHELIANDA